jgi:hypothetical protein
MKKDRDETNKKLITYIVTDILMWNVGYFFSTTMTIYGWK